MDSPVPVWIDDPNPLFRAGLAACLRRAAGFTVAGESCNFVPEPDLDGAGLVVFDLGDRKVTPGGDAWRPLAARVVGVLPTETLGDARPGRPCTILRRSTLTAESFLACLRSLTDQAAAGSAGPVRLGRAPGTGAARPAIHTLLPVEAELLRFLADGQTAAGIARLLGVSERTVIDALDELVTRLDCRTPVQAVALALRKGVI